MDEMFYNIMEFIGSILAGFLVFSFFVFGFWILVRMFDLITVTKTRYFVTCCIAFIFICIAFSSDDSDLSFFGILLGMIAAGVAIFYFIDNSCRCHHCGAWNSAKEVKCLSRETYKSLDNVKVKNKIYNNKNEEIGYIEDTRKELRNHTVRRVLYKCSNCGIEWEKVEHY